MRPLIGNALAILATVVLAKAIGATVIIKLATRDANDTQRAEILDALHETRLIGRPAVAIARRVYR